MPGVSFKDSRPLGHSYDRAVTYKRLNPGADELVYRLALTDYRRRSRIVLDDGMDEVFTSSQMRKRDLLWSLLSPVYLTLGTLRHEGSHALAAMAEGAEVTKLVFWPAFVNNKFSWGSAGWVGSTTWFTTAAPYFSDLITFFIAALIILVARPGRRWLWLNILIIGMLSPLVNTANNYISGLRWGIGDVGRLLQVLDPVAVHLYIALTILLYAWGLYYFYFRKKHQI